MLHEENISNPVEMSTANQKKEQVSENRSEPQHVTNSVVSCNHSQTVKTVILMTAVVRIKDPRGWTTPCRVLLDCGSQAGRMQLSDNLPELQETHFGWVVAGDIEDASTIQHCLVATTDPISDLLRQFWELEELLDSASQPTEEDECEKMFQSNHHRDETGRYVVSLPFRESVRELRDNRSLAMRRFLSLERRFRKDPELKQQYCQFIDEYIQLGHCQEVNESNHVTQGVYYLPHQAILRPSSTTTKIRVVFDASAKASRAENSLNDVLKVGATLQSDIFSFLLRFRKHQVVFTADITKMYRQIRIAPCFQRIFWRSNPDDPLRVLELTTVTYGTAAAPYLATRCLMQLCDDEGSSFPIAARIIRLDCYVDDVISGADTVEKAIECQT
ncbi:uncharacterized protein LOC131680860 [Topomyia yanbarensis]|uniref:uncharacterized protein LOC131680860 n=1 Tax=Topomyia yanbarensis TaxID=2498891 RepID=UPI00273C5987|nr:uncharacterized protein LOC131680860 [Topomyia yanbarensis]